MSTYASGNPPAPDPSDAVHETVGAYAIGVLDDAEATAFEEHLAGCERCAEQLEELLGMGPILAALADLPGGEGAVAADPAVAPGPLLDAEPPAPAVPSLPAARDGRHVADIVAAVPGPALAERLMDEVGTRRARRRRRSMYLVAAAAVLIVGGPLTAVAVNDGSPQRPTPSAVATSQDEQLQAMAEQLRATDATTKVSATIGLEPKAWGTHAMLELKNVKGPLKCSLIAVGKNGARETVASWAVPTYGYGIPDSSNAWARYPLYVQGGAALTPNAIDHFEVRTFDGHRLVEVAA